MRQICYVQSNGGPFKPFEAKEVGESSPRSWNVAPNQSLPIVAEHLDESTIDRHLLIARWGLVPSWAMDIKIGSCEAPGNRPGGGPLRVAEEATCTPRMPVKEAASDGYDGSVPDTSPEFLAIPVVKWAISELKKARIHPFFLAYLILRRHSVVSASNSGLSPNWVEEVGPLLAIPGGPPTKPYYRPFFDKDVRDESRYWMNRNLAGSYATSSIRKLAGELVSGSGNKYSLTEGHFARAVTTLISSTPVNAYAFSAFLFRNHGFSTSVPGGQPDMLVDALRVFLKFDSSDQGNDEFHTLFTVDTDRVPPFVLLEAADIGNLDEGGWTQISGTAEMTTRPVRQLTADDLGIGYLENTPTAHASNDPSAEPLADEDPLFVNVTRLLSQFGGVIFSGPPGTSKSYFAGLIAGKLSAAVPERSRFVQFHASYQYEDFMEGFAPKEDGTGFHLRRGHFVEMCMRAEQHPERTYIMVIDELSRADVGRVFGEALTYVEKSKRGIPFKLPSGRQISVPKNLYLIMTMNPLDKGVDEVDAAFERRFAKISFEADANQLKQMLEANGLDPSLSARLVAWFRATNGRAKEVPQAAFGHAYFASVVDVPTLRDVWQYQLKFHVERSFRYDQATKDEVVAGWQKVFRDVPGGWDGHHDTFEGDLEESDEAPEGASEESVSR